MASNVTQVTVISDCNDLYGSMGPKGHVRHLDLVMGAMPSPQWVPNSGWRGSFLAENLHVKRGTQWPLLAYIATQVTVISGCSSFLGSMGPRAHTQYLSQTVGGIVHARWGHNDLCGEGHFWSEMPMSEGGSAARSWPPMPLK